MADESKWWPQIMGHVLRYGTGNFSKNTDRTSVGALTFCTNGRNSEHSYRAYCISSDKQPSADKIYWGEDLLECRDRIAEYFRTREMFPVDQDQERTSA
jgi:hypothetical protein